MLQLQFFKDQKERILTGLKKRNWTDEEANQIVKEVLELNEIRRSTQNELDNTLAESNRLSKQIGDLIRQGQKQEAESIKSHVAELKEKSKNLDETLHKAAIGLETVLLSLPNIPHVSVPFGKTPDDNEVFQSWDKPLPTLPDDALSHWDLSDKFTVFDLELGVKLTGAGFPVYRGKGAKLVRALIQFFLDQASEAGYEEIIPPLLVNESSARGTGQLPDKEGQMYYVEKDDLYLIPTAEVPITNILRDEILNEKELPIKYCGYTQCFRREAGSYGAHVRGLNRVHQFDKIEIVQFAHPDKSYDTLMDMVNHVKGLMEKLELPYRILKLCGGDMGHASAMTFDFEVWSAAQKRWLEVSSVSNFETFQANRLKCRFRDSNNKTQLVHTLNGSALALGRIIAAILENNQTTEGVLMPKALVPYTKFEVLD
jgi:seryl-tRNA synthetase